jgi:hypothetical protein
VTIPTREPPLRDRIAEVLDYDPNIGVFTWLVTLANRAPAGSLAGCVRHDGYLVIRIDKVLYLGHMLAWLLMTGEWPTTEIDHKDQNPSNNKWSNLRLATHAQNITNQSVHFDNKSGHKGIYRHKNGRYYVNVGGTSHGGYANVEEAKAVYTRVAREYHGEFFSE